eukprot:Rmarinus@m.15653
MKANTGMKTLSEAKAPSSKNPPISPNCPTSSECKSVLKLVYDLFQLFYGPIEALCRAKGVDFVRDRVSACVPLFLRRLQVSQVTLAYALRGINFLPLEQSLFLRLQFFVNTLEIAFPQVRHTMVLYNSYLIWSGLDRNFSRAVYAYVQYFLLPGRHSQEDGLISADDPLAYFVRTDRCGFSLWGVPEECEAGTRVDFPSPRVHMRHGACRGVGGGGDSGGDGSADVLEGTDFRLAVYYCEGLTLCFVLERPHAASDVLYTNLTTVLAADAPPLAHALAAAANPQTTSGSDVSDDTFHILYYNSVNYAIKSTLRAPPPPSHPSHPSHVSPQGGPLSAGGGGGSGGGGSGSGGRLSPRGSLNSHGVFQSREVLDLVAEMVEDVRGSFKARETCLKTKDDCWVVCRAADGRYLVAVLDRKDASMVEAAEEVNYLSSVCFNGMFSDTSPVADTPPS